MHAAPSSDERFRGRKAAVAIALYTVLLAVVCLPDLAFLLGGKSALRSQDAPMACALGMGFVLSLAVFCNRHPAWLAISLTPFAALAPIEAWYIVTTGLPSDADALSLLRETNATELADLVSGLGWLGTTSLFAALLAITAAWCLHRSRLQWRHWSSIAVPLVFVASTGFAALFDQPAPDAQAINDPFGLLPVTTSQALRDNYPAGLALRIKDYVVQRGELMRAVERKADFRFGATRDPASISTAPDLVVLVIGESSRADHWSLNGYARATNPRLTQRSGLVSFRDFHSHWTYSREAIPVIVTRKPPESHSFAFGEPSLVSLFKEAGFATDWISVQPEVSFYDSPISIYAYEAAHTHFMNPTGFAGEGVHDDVVLPEFEKVLATDGGKPAFVVVHLLGSHYNYVHRYPPAFDVFKPTLRGIQRPGLFDRDLRERMVNSYDNSIVFTDHVLDGLIGQLEATGRRSLLFYVSDHGEDLFEDCSGGKSGHGNDTLFGHWVSALAWLSPTLQAAQPGLFQRFARLRDMPLVSSLVFDTMADVAGIAYPSARPSRDMLSGAMKVSAELAHIPAANGNEACSATARDNIRLPAGNAAVVAADVVRSTGKRMH